MRPNKRIRQGANGDRFEGSLYGPSVAVVKMTAHEDGAVAWIHASVPGGVPMFSSGSPTETSVRSTPCADAPQVETLSELLDFVVSRFGAVLPAQGLHYVETVGTCWSPPEVRTGTFDCSTDPATFTERER